MSSFRVLGGKFRFSGALVEEGSVVESSLPLNKMFPQKFALLPGVAPPQLVKVPSPPSKVSASTSVPPPGPAGVLVTDRFDVVPVGVEVSRKEGLFHIYDDGVLVGGGIKGKTEVTKRLKEMLKG